MIILTDGAATEVRAQHTLELLEALKNTGSVGRVTSLFLRNLALVACNAVNGTLHRTIAAGQTYGEQTTC